MFRSVLVALVLSTMTAFAAEPTLPELFTRAKNEFGAGDYKASLADFELLDAASRKAGFENDRAKLAPVILFYTGANLAALGRKDEAKDTFNSYLSFMPNASIASPPFSKEVVAAFDAARKDAATKNNSLEGLYARFVPPAGWKLAADDKWDDSPVRYLLTSDQKQQYAALTKAVEREAFVEKFWADYDPTPGTPANEFRAEFERRVAFADANFSTKRSAGGATERAAVLTFLGVPNYVGVSQLTANEDAIGVLRGGSNYNILKGVPEDGITGKTVETDSLHAKRESWYFRRNRLPAAVGWKELRFDFVTKEGYGTGILQKESEPMTALGLAVESARREKRLNQQ